MRITLKECNRKIQRIFQTMEHLISHHNDALPVMLHSGWPGNTNDDWSDGDGLMYMSFTHHAKDGQELHLDMDTDYNAVPWAAFPALLSIFKDHYTIEAKGDDGSAPLRRVIDWSVKKELGMTIPFLFHWDDWSEDDDLDVHCCSAEEWDSVMKFERSLLRTIIDHVERTSSDCEFHIGIHDTKNIEIISDIEDFEEWEEEVLERFESLANRGYVPICVQVAQDDECEDADIIYWFSKFRHEKHKDEEED